MCQSESLEYESGAERRATKSTTPNPEEGFDPIPTVPNQLAAAQRPLHRPSAGLDSPSASVELPISEFGLDSTVQMRCQKKCCVLTTMYKTKRFIDQVHPPYPFEKRKAGVLVKCGDKVLLVQSYNKSWGIPKGRVEISDKNLVDCAKRELLEETGIEIALKDSDLHKIVLDNCYIFEVFVESCDIVNPEHLPRLDSTGIGWVHRDCLTDFDITFLTRKALEDERRFN
jgi:8-oxo-dGTP pyrophosphatase MutT (NUDIX family)